MTATRCSCCGGSGKVMGGGMITDLRCDICYGTGKPEKEAKEIMRSKKVKNTKSYKAAKGRLQDKNPEMSDEEVERILDEELDKEIK